MKTLIGTVSWRNQGNSNICDDAGILGDFLLFYLTFFIFGHYSKGENGFQTPIKNKKTCDYTRPIP